MEFTNIIFQYCNLYIYKEVKQPISQIDIIQHQQQYLDTIPRNQPLSHFSPSKSALNMRGYYQNKTAALKAPKKNKAIQDFNIACGNFPSPLFTKETSPRKSQSSLTQTIESAELHPQPQILNKREVMNVVFQRQRTEKEKQRQKKELATLLNRIEKMESDTTFGKDQEMWKTLYKEITFL